MGAPRGARTWAETHGGERVLHGVGKKRSVMAFSLETSPGSSGTNMPLIFLHIPSVVPAGVWLQGALWLLTPSLPPTPAPRGQGKEQGCSLQSWSLQGEIQDHGSPRLLAAPRHSSVPSPCPTNSPHSPPSNVHLVGATLLFLSPLWPPAPPGNMGTPPPSLPGTGRASLRIKKSLWPDLCPGCVPQDPALLPAQD